MLLDWLVTFAEVAGEVSRPPMHRLLAGDGGREFHSCFRDQLRYAAQQQLLQREERAASMVYALTEKGRLVAMGGRDPERQWARPWDGRWRLMLFDLPANRRPVRQRLLRWLHRQHFGFLQNSVWIHPDPLSELTEALADYRADVEALTLMEAECAAGCANAALVQGAWDFEAINKQYASYLKSFGKRQAFAIKSGRGTFQWASGWLRAERVAWRNALELDPLLPQALLPEGYLGRKAWRARGRLVGALLSALGHGA